MTNNIPKYQFEAIYNRRKGTPRGYMLSCIRKDGKPGKPMFHDAMGCENCAEDVIARLEGNNPGRHWVVAE